MTPAPPGPSAPGLPLAYLAAGAVALALAALGVPWLAPELSGHYYHPRLVALTHLVTLGWITVTIMGASLQIVPIAVGRPVWSPRLARWQLALIVPGVAGMVAHFFMGRWVGLAVAAAAVGAAGLLHVVNVAATLRGLAARSFTASALVLAMAGLAGTVAFGLLLAVQRLGRWPVADFFGLLHAHVHLALLGWVAPMVLGVAARVYPMFLLAAEPAGWPGPVQLWGLGAGVPLVVAGLAAVPALVLPGALVVAAALVAHLVWMARMTAGRRRPALDRGLRLVLAGAAMLPVAMGLGLGLAAGLVEGPRVALAYAVLALGGWVTVTAAGMMLKVVPFLVWYRVYAPHAGRAPVPALAALGWPAAERAAGALLVAGMPLLALAVWLGRPGPIRLAGGVVAAGALALVAALAHVLGHLLRGGPAAAPAPVAP